MPAIVSLLVLAVAMVVAYVWLQEDKKIHDEETRRRGESTKLNRSSLKHYVRLTQKRPKEDLKIKVAESQDLEKALWKLVEYIIRDYIEWWYNPISRNPDFTNDVRHVFEQFLAKLVSGLKKVQWGDLLQEFLVELRKTMKSYRVAEIALEKRFKEFSGLDLHERQGLILQNMYGNYELHVAVVIKPETYLRQVCEVVLRDVLKPRDFACKPLVALVREILAVKVLEPVMWYANSNQINKSIVSMCRKAGIHADDEGAAAAAAAAAAKAEAEAVRAWGDTKSTLFQGTTSKSLSAQDEDGEEDEGARSSGTCADDFPAQGSQLELNSGPPHMPKNVQKSETAAFIPKSIDNSNRQTLLSPSEVSHFEKVAPTGSSGGTKNRVRNSIGEFPDIEERYRRWIEHKENTLRGGGVIPSSFPQKLDALSQEISEDSSGQHLNQDRAGDKGESKDTAAAGPRDKRSPIGKLVGAHGSNGNRVRLQSGSSTSRRQTRESLDLGGRSRSGTRSSLFESLSRNSSTTNSFQREGRLLLKMDRCIKAATPKPHVRYHILCQNGKYIKWAVEKRYNEFYDLHRALKKKHPQGGNGTVWASKFPKKSLLRAFTQNNMDDAFIEERGEKLQQYLEACCSDPAEIGQVVGSDCFREFIIPTIQVELNGDANNDSVKRNKKTDEKNKGDWEQGSIKRKELLGHIYGLVDEIFELTRHGFSCNASSEFSREIASSKIFYNSSLYERVEETMTKYTSEDTLIGAVNGLVSMMWPKGQLYYLAEDYKAWVHPTIDEETKMQQKAAQLLVIAIDSMVPMLGKDYCMKGAVKFLEFLQVDAIVQHLGYFLLEKLLPRVFPNSKAEFEDVRVHLASSVKRERNETRKKAEQAKAQLHGELESDWKRKMRKSAAGVVNRLKEFVTNN